MRYKELFCSGEENSFAIKEDTVGWYLIVYDSINSIESDVSTEDYLLDTLEDAFEMAYKKFGVYKSAWKEK